MIGSGAGRRRNCRRLVDGALLNVEAVRPRADQHPAGLVQNLGHDHKIAVAIPCAQGRQIRAQLIAQNQDQALYHVTRSPAQSKN